MTWYKNELLVLAKELGLRLLPSFNSTTGETVEHNENTDEETQFLDCSIHFQGFLIHALTFDGG